MSLRKKVIETHGEPVASIKSCSYCTRDATHHFDGPSGYVYLCPICYEQRRDKSGLDGQLLDVLDAHPEWSRGPAEEAGEYRQRMMAQWKQLTHRWQERMK